jgi:DNA polymerase-1
MLHMYRIKFVFLVFVRFWGKIPLQVIDDMQKRDEKRRVVSRNSNAPPGLEFTTILRDGTRALWKQESNELLKQKCEYDGSVYSFKYERMDINAIQTQDKPKSQKQLISRNVGQLVDNKRPNGSSLDDILKESAWNNGSFMQRMENEKQFQSSELGHTGIGSNEQVQTKGRPHKLDIRERLTSIYESVLVVDNVTMAKEVVSKLTNQYRHLIHACDTEVCTYIKSSSFCYFLLRYNCSDNREACWCRTAGMP